LISTSLQCRIIAFSFYVPRVTVIWGLGGKIGQHQHFEFIKVWDEN